jgi:spermidine synthase
MKPWVELARGRAPDGETLVLKQRGREFLIDAGGRDLMSSEDEGSSRALAELGCAHISTEEPARVLVGGLGMGYTLRAALDATGPAARIEVAEFVAAVAQWNTEFLGELAANPLQDTRCGLHIGNVRERIRDAGATWDAILLDVDNGPSAHAHAANSALYSERGIDEAWQALRPGGVLGVWSFSGDSRFTRRLEKRGFEVEVSSVAGSRKGRGKHHVIWIARRPKKPRGERTTTPRGQPPRK